MSDKIEYSRLLLKRSNITGVEPTITSATTLNNFINTDLFDGEMFLNTTDERAFVRMGDNILEFDLVSSGTTDFDFCATGIKTSAISGCSPVDIYDDFNFQSQKNITTSNGDAILRLDDGGNPDTIYLGFTGGTSDYLSIDPNGNTNGTTLVSQNGNDNSSIYLEPTFSSLSLIINNSDYESSIIQQYRPGKLGNNQQMTLSTIDNLGGGEATIILNSYDPFGGGGLSSVNINTDTLFYGTTNPLHLYQGNANHQLQFSNQQVDLFNGTPSNTEINIGNSTSTINLSGQTTVHQKMTVKGDIDIQNNSGISFFGNNAIAFKQIDIGDWDMDATASVNIAHGLSVTEWKTIRQIDVIIRNDADTGYYPLRKGYDGVTGNGFVNVIGSTNITLNRVTGGDFDNVNFDSTSYNRGWVTFWYVPN